MINFLARSSFAGFVLAISIVAGAQSYAPGEAVVLPGAEIADWGRVEKVDGHFGRPSANAAKVPAVGTRLGVMGLSWGGVMALLCRASRGFLCRASKAVARVSQTSIGRGAEQAWVPQRHVVGRATIAGGSLCQAS